MSYRHLAAFAASSLRLREASRFHPAEGLMGLSPTLFRTGCRLFLLLGYVLLG